LAEVEPVEAAEVVDADVEAEAVAGADDADDAAIEEAVAGFGWTASVNEPDSEIEASES
jgi:hypothetical protein